MQISVDALFDGDNGRTMTDLIKDTEESLVLISPWLKIDGHMKISLLNLVHSGKACVHIITRPKDRNLTHNNNIDELIALQKKVGKRKVELNSFKKVDDDIILLTFVKHLHAKMMWVDNRTLLVSSANLIESSMSRNVEAGIIIDPNKDMSIKILDFIRELTSRNPQSLDEEPSKIMEVLQDGSKCIKCGKVKENKKFDTCTACYFNSRKPRTKSTKCPKCGGYKQPWYQTCWNCKGD